MASQLNAGVVPNVQVEREFSLACIKLVHYDLFTPLEGVLDAGEDYVVDLSLTPRLPNARGRVPIGAGTKAFEKIGSLFLLPAGHYLQGRADTGRQTSLHCRFKMHALEQWTQGDIRWTNQSVRFCLSIDSSEIQNALFRLAGELRTPGLASDAICELLASQIAIDLARHCDALPSGASAMGGLAPWQLRVIDDRLNDESTPPTLSELAALCGISSRHLNRGFGVSRGVSVGRYIERHYIEAAKQYLVDGLAIKDIAFRMGYSSASSFTSAFRRSVGVTPRAFRQRTHNVLS